MAVTDGRRKEKSRSAELRDAAGAIDMQERGTSSKGVFTRESRAIDLLLECWDHARNPITESIRESEVLWSS